MLANFASPGASRYAPAIANVGKMSSTLPAATPEATAPDDMLAALQGLRAEIDAIDDTLHDLLMRRGAVVGKVAELRKVGKIAFRPGREADIVQRLLARHAGPLPASGIVRLWRELFATSTSIEVGFAIAVCETTADGQCAALAREHFGALTPLRVLRSPAQAIAEVSAGRATAAVLPMPVDEDLPQAAWWTALLHRDEPRIHVVARLPYWAPRPEGAPQVQALVVAASAPDRSLGDRSLLGLELPPDMSRARLSAALATVGFTPGSILLRRAAGGQVAHGLIDVEGYVSDDDGRLLQLQGTLQRPVVLGAYAVPVGGVQAAAARP